MILSIVAQKNNFPIGKNIKRLRNNENITLDQFSKETSINLKSLMNYETRPIIPPLFNLVSIANFFDVTLDYLIRSNQTDYPFNLKLFSLALKIDALDQSKRFQVESTANSFLQGKEKMNVRLDTTQIELENTIHENIKKIRTEKNILQKSIAELLEVEQGVASRYEKNVTPSIDKIVRLSEFFGVSIHALATGQKLSFNFIDGHLEKTILQADKLLSLEEHKMLIHLMETIINNKT
jgi:transcriptional regulator with XRE-family HTH domain